MGFGPVLVKVERAKLSSNIAAAHFADSLAGENRCHHLCIPNRLRLRPEAHRAVRSRELLGSPIDYC